MTTLQKHSEYVFLRLKRQYDYEYDYDYVFFNKLALLAIIKSIFSGLMRNMSMSMCFQ